MSIHENAPSNYRTPAVHRTGPPPRTDRRPAQTASDFRYSKKVKMRIIHELGLLSSTPVAWSWRPLSLLDAAGVM